MERQFEKIFEHPSQERFEIVAVTLIATFPAVELLPLDSAIAQIYESRQWLADVGKLFRSMKSEAF